MNIIEPGSGPVVEDGPGGQIRRYQCKRCEAVTDSHETSHHEGCGGAYVVVGAFPDDDL